MSTALTPARCARHASPDGEGERGEGVALRFYQTGFALFLFMMPITVAATPVINEVMWMGSDLSTSDEWVEVLNPDDTEADLSGWMLTSVNSKGEEAMLLRFATGTVLESGEFIVIANAHAASSRLLEEPSFITSAMSLPNTKLLLRLRGSDGQVVDIADDGIGAPFAGLNPSGGVKASMERIDPLLPGTDAGNWATGILSIGFDDAAMALGTPGYANSVSVLLPPPSSEASSSIAPSAQGVESSSSSSPAPCSDPLSIQIYVQDGALHAIGKTTVNFQAVAVSGSIVHAACHWNFSDGYTSTSCNPPAHAFDEAGDFLVHLEAINQCGNTLIQEAHVVVDVDPTAVARQTSSSSAGPVYDGSRLVLTSALPNPEGADTGREWFELRNLEDHPVDLSAWKVGVGETSVQRYSLKGTIEAGQRLKIYNSELKFTLSNSDSRLRLYDPLGNEKSSVDWPKAAESHVYYSDDLSKLDAVRARVLDILDPVTLLLSVSGKEAELLGVETLPVKLLGLTSPDIFAYPDITYNAVEFLRALLQEKNIELEFDTTMWTSDGFLEAYISTEDSLSPAKELLLKGFVSTDDSFEYTRHEEFDGFQMHAKRTGLGLWNPSVISMNENTKKALIEEKNSSFLSSSTKASKTGKKPAVKKMSTAAKKLSMFVSLYRADLEKENGDIFLKEQEISAKKPDFFGYIMSLVVGTLLSILLHRFLPARR